MRIRIVGMVLGLAALTSCQDGKPKGDLPPLHPVKGKVLQNGQPVSGGGVQFRTDPETADLVISAEVTSDGTFELQTVHTISSKVGKGAPAGTYKVTYQPPLSANAAPMPVTPKQTQTIQAGSNDLTVEVGKK
ncbi:MAG TPA: hypothetical protein VHR66_02890 [Gemmataceae bacterium]|jgi:hypothetical protein|nr:hypothetical protein [Gemmataceae bacterium]